MTEESTPPAPDSTPVREPATDSDDGYQTLDPESTEEITEDEPQLLDAASRVILQTVDNGIGDAAQVEARDVDQQHDDTSDTDAIQDEPSRSDSQDSAAVEPDWATELSARRIAIELKHVEKNVRDLLEGRDTKRKRKLGGTRRWYELEEDIIAWRHADRIDPDTLNRLHEMIARRHHLFQRLKFLAGTRPTWNS